MKRYAGVLGAVEINSSFYREHQPKTYRRWAESVPADFRFSVKLSKRFTHEERLASTEGLAEILEGISELGDKWGALLLQLPPSLSLDVRTARAFLRTLRELYDGPIACEPRHATWGGPAGSALFGEFRVARVVADPERIHVDSASEIAASPFAYYRLHGAPVVYRSDYDAAALASWRERIARNPAREIWCIFDNTTFGFATDDAVKLQTSLRETADASGLTKRKTAYARGGRNGATN